MTSFPTALHHRIRELAQQAPDAPALAAPFQNDLRLSRGALDACASRLAQQLRAAGVGAEVRVGVCVERSPGLLVAILAVLRAGSCYVPLDPRYPAERLEFMVRDSGTSLLLTTPASRENCPAGPTLVDHPLDAPSTWSRLLWARRRFDDVMVPGARA